MKKKKGGYQLKTKNYFKDEKRNLELYDEMGVLVDQKDGKLDLKYTAGYEADMCTIAADAADISWRATSKPFGIMAQKRVS